MNEFVSTTTITTDEYNRLRDDSQKVKKLEGDLQAVVLKVQQFTLEVESVARKIKNGQSNTDYYSFGDSLEDSVSRIKQASPAEYSKLVDAKKAISDSLARLKKEKNGSYIGSFEVAPIIDFLQDILNNLS